MGSWTETRATWSTEWVTRKPQLIALAIGLIAGPLISNYAGWQVTSGNAQIGRAHV